MTLETRSTKTLTEEWDALTLDALRDRRGYKWSKYPTGVIPAWVADMDLPAARVATDAVVDFWSRGDLAYFDERIFNEVKEIGAARMLTRFGWSVAPGQVELLDDTVQSLHLMVDHLTRPGDGVAVVTPIYPHFLNAVRDSGRVPRPVNLLDTADGWQLDLNALERVFQEPRTRLLLLCHPHNPTGRVFTAAEVGAIAELALAHGVRVVTDEIHAELTHDGRPHVPLASVSAAAAHNTVTLTSASKAFNIAGTHLGLVIYGSTTLRRAMPPQPSRAQGKPGISGCLATRAVWLEADDWLEAAQRYLQGNRDHLVARLRTEAPQVRLHSPQATYLAWLDLGAVTDDAYRFLLERARVATSPGTDFCWPNGDGGRYARLNFATGRPVVDDIVDRIVGAVSGRGHRAGLAVCGEGLTESSGDGGAETGTSS